MELFPGYPLHYSAHLSASPNPVDDPRLLFLVPSAGDQWKEHGTIDRRSTQKSLKLLLHRPANRLLGAIRQKKIPSAACIDGSILMLSNQLFIFLLFTFGC
jgi:hypothetical protein